MTDLFFFTDFDLLDDYGAANAQSASDAFGPQSPSVFRLNSKHRSKSAIAPTAYAVVKGYVLIHPIPSDLVHVNLILKPFEHPAENGGLGLPRVKYIIYRNVKKDSIIAGGSNPESFVPAGSIDMVDKIRDTYRFSPSSEVPPGSFMTSGIATDPIEKAFASITQPWVAAGMSIGKFDPSGFSLEIVLDDIGFNPDLDFASRSYDGDSLYTVPPGSASPADNFRMRARREYVLSFLDPCAFYANMYFTGLRAKNSDGSDTAVNGKTKLKGNDIYPLISKFINKNKAYIDIRNENNHSFNYYGFVNDVARKDSYSIYSDAINIDLLNSGGAVSAPSTNYYGSYDWPMLIVDNSQFNSGNDKEKNIVSIKLPKGNNNNATLFISIGIRNKGQLGDDLNLKKSGSGHTFVDLGLQPGATEYDAFELVIPNNKMVGTTTLIPTYSRLKYIRRIAAVDLFTDPTDNDVQFLDNIFVPAILKDKLSGASRLEVSVYENEQYVDVTNGDQISMSEFVGNTGIAVSNNSVTLFCYPLHVQRKNSSSKSKQRTQTTTKSDTIKELIDEFGATGNKKSPFIIETLDLVTAQPKVVYYERRERLFPNLSDDDYDSMLMLILDKNNFVSEIINTISDPSPNNRFSPEFDVHLTIKAQTHRDQDAGNDNDSSIPSKAYSKCSLFLKGFKLDNGNVNVVDVDTGIRLYSKREGDFKVHTILKDSDAVLETTSSDFMPFVCGFLIEQSGPTRPTVHTPYSDIDGDDYLGYFTNTPSGSNLNQDTSERFNNIYNEDLKEFIGRLYDNSQDATSRKLYQYVFSKFIKTQSVLDSRSLFAPDPDSSHIQLNFVSGKISHGDSYMHQGLLLEGANYFAVWKISESLKIIQGLFEGIHFYNPSQANMAAFKAKLRDRYDFIVRSYSFLNNLVESLKSQGLRSPVEIVDADSEDSINVGGLRDGFAKIFWQDRTASGIIRLVRSYYETFDKSHGSKITYEALKAALNQFNSTKQNYVSQLSRRVYEGLGGTLSDYTLLNVALGNGSSTLGLFGSGAGTAGEVGGEGIFLFNYSYQKNDGVGDIVRTKEILQIDNLPINNTNNNPYAMHFGIYGIDEVQIVHRIMIKRDGITVRGNDPATGVVKDAFTLNLEYLDGNPTNTSPGNLSFKSNAAAITGVGMWNNLTKDLIIENPKSNNYTSLSLSLDSKTDEETFSLVLYKTSSPTVLHYSKSFEDLFDNDCYQLTPSKADELWQPQEQETLASLIEILKTDSAIKIQLTLGGGIGRRKLATSFDAFDAATVYPPNAFVIYEASLYKSLERVSSGNFDHSQWMLQSMVETDPDYVFHPPLSGSAWLRTREEKLTKPAAGTPEDIDDSKLRYSYASIIFDVSTNQLMFNVESYASALISNLDAPASVGGMMSGVSPNQWLCLSDSTIYKQNPSSQAYVKDTQGVMIKDSYNQLLSALRSCGLLNAILDRIKLEAFDTQDDAAYTSIANKIDAFKNNVEVKVALTPDEPASGVVKKELSLATFLKIVNNTCP